LKNTSSDHPDYADLSQARIKIEQVTEALDIKKQQAENMGRLMNISDNISKKKVTIAEPHRRFLREGNLIVERDSKKQHYVFLFNDLLVLTTSGKKPNTYVFVDHLDLRLVTKVDDSLPDNGFILLHETKTKMRLRGFYAASEEERVSWVIDVKSALHDLEATASRDVDIHVSNAP